MAPPFAQIAAYYDLLYDSKDYSGEALFIDQLIRDAVVFAKPWSLLDLACGSARHTIEFARLGYAVAGSEPSEEMRVLAKRNLVQAGLEFPLYEYPFQSCHLIGDVFQILTSLFASFGYLVDDADIALSLSNIRRLLVPGGVFIFDIWNADAVRSDYQAVKVLEKQNEYIRLKRTSRTQLDLNRCVAEVEFFIELVSKDGLSQRFKETHAVRFFEPQKLQSLLDSQGLLVERVVPFGDSTRSPLEKDWSLTFVCRRE